MIESEEGLFLLVNKPLHWTSFDAVNKLRFVLKTRKIGHAGTLDPLATGLLIVCTGKMTKQIDRYQGLEKEYTGTFMLGQTTPSYDLETELTPMLDIDHVTEAMIRQAAATFLGKIMQVPPAHSSVKIDGRRAYTMARKGQAPVLTPREIEIREFEITRIEKPAIDFRVVCSKGTYIRSLAHDFGERLKVGAHLSQLCRTRIGEYLLTQAETIADIRNRYLEITNDPTPS